MIDFYMNYRASMFIDTIEATSSNIKQYLELFSEDELLPNASTEMQMFFPNSIQKNIFELKKMDDSYSVRFGIGRIDIIRFKISEIDDIGSIDDFVAKAKVVFDKILECSGKKGHRLALAFNCCLKANGSQGFDKLYQAVSKPPIFYSENRPFEWNINQTALFDLKTDSWCERINCISRVSVDEISLNEDGVIVNENRAFLNCDFNTLANIKEARFDKIILFEFYDKILVLCKRIVDEYNKIIENEQEKE